jgi:DNA mismatch repair protein MutS2
MLKENARLKKDMEALMDKEKKEQQVLFMKLQNQVKEEQITYLKDMERKLRQMVLEWKKAEDKDSVMQQMEALLFRKKEKKVVQQLQKKVDARYVEVPLDIQPGQLVKMKKNHQVGTVLELRGKRALVKIGLLPMQVAMSDLVAVKEKPAPEPES